ncbi:hypothetical protein ILFOPFJJ_05875 [Ensifer psoraleae]|uniref:hypothetical protein n=1 Tax=Sinorhizobium psoraleae TaxID=520838 RepID=UPI0015689F3F|nr:hypothetical protein [Sinorhizobium psoraleae]NRP74952.1 hypothetical protein [Sinorhizobium psoraleae]
MSNLVALLFGAAIVLFYSYNRFNRVTYEGGRQMERLVDLLSPDKLRARRIVMHAYTFYALILLLIYFFLCAYAELLPLLGGPDLAVGASKLPVPSAEAPGAVIAGFAPGNDAAIPWTLSSVVGPATVRDFDIGIDASVSLAIALIMVGLAPTFPLLGNFEDWMRGAAHRLAGIPTHVIGASEDLRRRDLKLRGKEAAISAPTVDATAVKQQHLLIPLSSWDRLKHYQAAAKEQVNEREDFRLDLELIFAVSAWILDRKLKLANGPVRERFQQLEEELRKRRDQLIVELDDRSGFGLSAAKNIVTAAGYGTRDANLGERKRATWERLASDADNLADDFCFLLALYVEHGIIIASSDEDAAHQQFIAKKKLDAFLGGLLHPHLAAGSHKSHATMASLWALGVVFFVGLFWGVVPGRFEDELVWDAPTSVYSRTLSCIFYAFNNYCIPIIVTLALRDAGMQSRRWHNIRKTHWTKWLPQVVLVLVASWAVATLFVMGLQLWKTGFDTGWAASGKSLGVILQYSFEYNAPTVFRGASLALIVAFLLDAWSAQARTLSLNPPLLSSLLWATGSAVVMAVFGGITRYAAAWAAMPSTTQSLTDIHRGLIFYSIVFSALIGFLVVFCITAALLNLHSGSERRPGAKTSRPAAPDPTPAE